MHRAWHAKAVTEMKPPVAVPLLLIAEIIGSADQMPTDRSLNRVKQLRRSRFGQQTLHLAKEEILLLASRENTPYPNQPKPACSRWWHACSAGCHRFKGGSGINGILPAERAPAIYFVSPWSRLGSALGEVTVFCVGQHAARSSPRTCQSAKAPLLRRDTKAGFAFWVMVESVASSKHDTGRTF